MLDWINMDLLHLSSDKESQTPWLLEIAPYFY